MVEASTLARQSASCADVLIYKFNVELPELAECVAQILEWHIDMLDLVVLAQVTDPRNSTFAVLQNCHHRKLRQITSNSAVIVSLTPQFMQPVCLMLAFRQGSKFGIT